MVLKGIDFKTFAVFAFAFCRNEKLVRNLPFFGSLNPTVDFIIFVFVQDDLIFEKKTS